MAVLQNNTTLKIFKTTHIFKPSDLAAKRVRKLKKVSTKQPDLQVFHEKNKHWHKSFSQMF